VAVFLSVALLVILAGGGLAAYWFLFSPHRYVGTYNVKSISAMGMSIEVAEFGKMMGGVMGAMGTAPGSGAATPTMEILLELKSDGTGTMTTNLSGFSGALAAAAASSNTPQPVKWHTVKGGGIAVEMDASAAGAANPMAGLSTGTTAFEGKLEKGVLTLSADAPNPLAGGTMTVSMVCNKK
jgi:hypothetical protein